MMRGMWLKIRLMRVNLLLRLAIWNRSLIVGEDGDIKREVAYIRGRDTQIEYLLKEMELEYNPFIFVGVMHYVVRWECCMH